MALLLAGKIRSFQISKTNFNRTFSSSGAWSAISRPVKYTAQTYSSSATSKVKTLRTTYVKPYKQLGKKDCQLITFDLQCLRFQYIQRLFIYRGGSHEFEKVEEKLREGLRDVLVDFYPLAGKIGKDEEGILRVEYGDDMDGAEVTIAAAENTRVEDLDHKVVGTYKDFVPYNGVCNLEGFHRSLLAVQLTKLKDGFGLGCALNHAVVDGTFAWHFLKSWADRCKGTTSIYIKPFHDRTKARNTRVKVSLPLTSLSPIDLQLTNQRRFSFSESTIDHIKSNINKHITKTTTNAKPFSTFSCVATHVWRAISRARQLMPEDITVLNFAINLRTRLDPPMPASYFGNLVQVAITETTARVLLDSPQETCASLIKQAIEMHNSNIIHTRATEWEKTEKQLQLPDFGRNAVIIGSSPMFKVYELDFGWGKPEMVTSGCTNRFEGIVFLHQGKSGGRSLDIDVSLEDKAMKRLEMDKEFLC